MLLREQHLFESDHLATLCAAVLLQPGPQSLQEVSLLITAAGPDNPVAKSLAWEGISAFAPSLPAHQSHSLAHTRHLPEEDEEIDDGVVVPLDFGQDHLSSHDLADMALTLEEQFEQNGQTLLLTEAIRLRRKALSAAPRRTRDLHLDLLATTLQMQFEAGVSHKKDIDEAIDLHRKALAIRADPHPQRDVSMVDLANALRCRFDHFGRRKDLDEAVEFLRKLLAIQPSPHLNRLECLNSLAVALQNRHDNYGEEKDSQDAIQLFREALALHSPENINRTHGLCNLANALRSRFGDRGNVENLQEARKLFQEAVDMTPTGHPDRGHTLNCLGAVFLAQFGISGDTSNIEESVRLHRKALAHYSPHDPDRSTILNDLADALYARYYQTNNPRDINESVDLHRECLSYFPAPHTSRAGRLHNLAVSLQFRYETCSGNHETDLQEAIELHREALILHAVPHPDRHKSLRNLADVLKVRFEYSMDQKDIDESIRLHRESLQLVPSDSDSLRLASAILMRFKQWKDPQDLAEALQISRDSLARCPPVVPGRGQYFNHLGVVLCISFSHTNDIRELEESIKWHREAVQAFPLPHSSHSNALNDLAAALRLRFLHDKVKNWEDIWEVIELHRVNLGLRPHSHPSHSTTLTNLANAFYDVHGDLEDIQEAILLHNEVLELHPAPYADRALYLGNLAACLHSAYTHEQSNIEHLHQCMARYKEAATYASAPPTIRFEHATSWAQTAMRYPETRTSALEAYQVAVGILPQLASLGLDLQSRLRLLASTASSAVGAGAADCALSCGQPGLAVELLEASRSVFWTQALKLRTPLADLHEKHPKLAVEFEKISHGLEQAGLRNREGSSKVVLEADGERCRDLNEQWTNVVRSIQEKDGFRNFMRPLGIETLQKVASRGPVVLISPGDPEAHALIVQDTGVQSVPLPFLTPNRVKYLSDSSRAWISGSQFDFKELKTNRGDHNVDRLVWNREFQDPRTKEQLLIDLLSALWSEIAHPIISRLGLQKSTKPGRLWWCLTGTLTFLPIHAARIIGESPDCVSDYFISSYTPTLTALLNPPSEESPEFPKMTTVIVPNAPNKSYLAGAQAELAKIKGLVPKQWKHTVVGETAGATMDATTTALENCSIAHFACHGVQDPVKPLNSGLELSDGRLGITELMRSTTSIGDRAQLSLAFLSACETATGDSSTPDEAMHLAGAMMFAGFRSVVGTMWRMDDSDGPKIAETFYKNLFNSQPSESPKLLESAPALHSAVRKLREDTEVTHLRWAPFVHYGW
ncbi:CHAT domain-containing protein [Roridomyces roridus]|uniref:CHAT domain-containing protein n=1 Tax=Roridomyces roridus TaxID=1738132 RepID=A0AAD7FCQ1_9AGAR|nr:CHAT domain-containing protein [Roridomyces roridus]